MKASGLLRAWTRRLESHGRALRTRWRWLGWQAGAAVFATPEGVRGIRAGATVLALGGGSWARLGSDGAWTAILAGEGVEVAPFRPSNVGFRVAWSPAMARHFGAPVKPVRLTAAGSSVTAEFVVSAAGVEGGGVYALAHLLRDGAPLVLDLVPGRSEADVAARLARPRKGASLGNHLRKTLGLSPVKIGAAARVRAAGARLAGGDRPRAQGAAAAARRAAADRRRHLDRRRRHPRRPRRGPDAARQAGGLLRRRDARLGRAHRRLSPHRVPRHRPPRRTRRRPLARRDRT